MNDRFPTSYVARLTGVTRRQLQYWAQTGLIEPSAKTRGGHGRYTRSDMVTIASVKRLTDSGVSIHRLRRVLPAMKLIPRSQQRNVELALTAALGVR